MPVQGLLRIAPYPIGIDARKVSSGAIGRGSVIGFVLGILPGGGAVLSALAATRWSSAARRAISGTLLVAFVLVAALPFARRAWRRKEEPVESA